MLKPPVFALLVVTVLAAVILASPVPKKKAHHGSLKNPHHFAKPRHPRSTDDADYRYAFRRPFQRYPSAQYGTIIRDGAYYPPIGLYPPRGGPYVPVPVVVPYQPGYSEYDPRPLVDPEDPSVVPGPVNARPRPRFPLPIWNPIEPAVEGPYQPQVEEPSDREGQRLTPFHGHRRLIDQGSETARRFFPDSSVDENVYPRQTDYSDYGHKDRAKKDASTSSVGSKLIDALKLLR